ncbi:MAG: hypothetical protein ABI230_01055 [Aestuariivirga sp.]
MTSNRELKVGDRVWLSGGYDMDPKWLNSGVGYEGVVRSFIPGQNAKPAVVVQLAKAITVEDAVGKYLVLELRYTGATWQEKQTVHLELCSEIPERKRWQERAQGKWIESHASYKII